MSENGAIPIDKDAGLFVLTLKFNPVSKALHMSSTDNANFLLMLKLLTTAQNMAIDRMAEAQKHVESLITPASGPLPPA